MSTKDGGEEQQYSVDFIEHLVRKRIESWKYLKRAHEGSVFWMNVVFLTKEDISNYYTDPKVLQKRAEEWFCLGIPNGAPILTAISQLWDEYESHYGYITAIQKMMKVTQKAEEIEYLTTPNIPSTLDYFQIVYAFFDLLVHIYQKFMAPSEKTVSKEFYALISKVDNRFKQYIIAPISKDLNAVGLHIIKTQLCSVENIYKM